MSDYKYSAEDILFRTNGGLDIILEYFPQAEKCIERSYVKFKTRNENTASASIKKCSDHNWILTDFGDAPDRYGKPRNGIQVCMIEEKVDYGNACQILAKRYHIEGETASYSPEWKEISLNKDDKKGDYSVEYNEEFTDKELSTLFSRANDRERAEKILNEYRVRSVKYYTLVTSSKTDKKRLKKQQISSTENYPIFAFIVKEKDKEYIKLYQPRAKKKYRFMWFGGRPSNHVWGLDVAVRMKKKATEIAVSRASTEEEMNRAENKTKLDEIILCSGDRDALNIAYGGYAVIWLNSETADFKTSHWKELRKLAHKIYQVPDLDKTGKRQGKQRATDFLELYTIWLPKQLRLRRDWRGNSCKDVTDYFRFYTYQAFSSLMKNSLCLQFWTRKEKRDKNGNISELKYTLSPTYFYYFLEHFGFYKAPTQGEKSKYEFIRIDGSVVRKIEETSDITGFVNNFLTSRALPVELRDVCLTSTLLSETSYTKMKVKSIDYISYTSISQYIFFENVALFLKKGENIVEKTLDDADTFVLEENLIKHQFELLPDFFNIQKDGIDWRIDIKEQDCEFLNYLINASRIHWQVEFGEKPRFDTNTKPYYIKMKDKDLKDYKKENKFTLKGSNLNDIEIIEQQHHLVNKIFSIGYLLHRYKSESRAWAPFVMDSKIADDVESNGGSGKSICFSLAMKEMLNFFTRSGRNKEATKNDHYLDGLTDKHDYFLIDDTHKYFDFNFFYSYITDDISVNPKNAKPFSIPFSKSCKIAFTSNYTPPNNDPSTERRLLYVVFSDWYHQKTEDNHYKETRRVSDDFGGKNFFSDWSYKQKNMFYNFMLQCLKFYLSLPGYEKIGPPMNNVIKRQLKSEMGAAFESWADTYLASQHDQLIHKDDAFKAFKETSNLRNATANSFKKKVVAYCKYHNYEFNPTPERGGYTDATYTCVDHKPKIVKNVYEPVAGTQERKRKTEEFFYIMTKNEISGVAIHDDEKPL